VSWGMITRRSAGIDLLRESVTHVEEFRATDWSGARASAALGQGGCGRSGRSRGGGHSICGVRAAGQRGARGRTCRKGNRAEDRTDQDRARGAALGLRTGHTKHEIAEGSWAVSSNGRVEKKAPDNVYRQAGNCLVVPG